MFNYAQNYLQQHQLHQENASLHKEQKKTNELLRWRLPKHIIEQIKENQEHFEHQKLMDDTNIGTCSFMN
jgi:mRNA degradation ribonuclease J1/J2